MKWLGFQRLREGLALESSASYRRGPLTPHVNRIQVIWKLKWKKNQILFFLLKQKASYFGQLYTYASQFCNNKIKQVSHIPLKFAVFTFRGARKSGS